MCPCSRPSPSPASLLAGNPCPIFLWSQPSVPSSRPRLVPSCVIQGCCRSTRPRAQYATYECRRAQDAPIRALARRALPSSLPARGPRTTSSSRALTAHAARSAARGFDEFTIIFVTYIIREEGRNQRGGQARARCSQLAPFSRSLHLTAPRVSSWSPRLYTHHLPTPRARARTGCERARAPSDALEALRLVRAALFSLSALAESDAASARERAGRRHARERACLRLGGSSRISGWTRCVCLCVVAGANADVAHQLCAPADSRVLTPAVIPCAQIPAYARRPRRPANAHSRPAVSAPSLTPRSPSPAARYAARSTRAQAPAAPFTPVVVTRPRARPRAALPVRSTRSRTRSWRRSWRTRRSARTQIRTRSAPSARCSGRRTWTTAPATTAARRSRRMDGRGASVSLSWTARILTSRASSVRRPVFACSRRLSSPAPTSPLARSVHTVVLARVHARSRAFALPRPAPSAPAFVRSRRRALPAPHAGCPAVRVRARPAAATRVLHPARLAIFAARPLAALGRRNHARLVTRLTRGPCARALFSRPPRHPRRAATATARSYSHPRPRPPDTLPRHASATPPDPAPRLPATRPSCHVRHAPRARPPAPARLLGEPARARGARPPPADSDRDRKHHVTPRAATSGRARAHRAIGRRAYSTGRPARGARRQARAPRTCRDRTRTRLPPTSRRRIRLNSNESSRACASWRACRLALRIMRARCVGTHIFVGFR
jgi:hypothetical protein